ncbi:phage tail terminator protein [Endozoicomonas numazuensis]|uniref:Uncharacterized protein n=1 Tax=Endozoicomonas numazuensis TaxID=1137799 RepID=A0A081NL48_9GAMM|nr:hypothetical protein [Endozoicomonas numazuensis]KEQ19171.1 hypothetical protein GZ78_04020 [Endozoicomonas numazuensis]
MDAVSVVIEQLKQGVPPWVEVKGLLALSDLDKQALNRTPALFVINLAERAAPDVRGSGPALQTVSLTLGVVVVEKAHNREPDLLPLRQEIRRRLFGWAPQGFEALTLDGGQLLNIHKGQVAWIDKFTTEYTEDANHGS